MLQLGDELPLVLVGVEGAGEVRGDDAVLLLLLLLGLGDGDHGGAG